MLLLNRVLVALMIVSIGLTVYFTNQATGGYNYIYYDYGDGNWVEYVNNPTHTYSQAGIYEVCQYIEDTNSWNCWDYVCDTLYIGGASCFANFWIEQDDLEATFYPYAFGSFDSVLWDFGDGTFSSDTPAVHEYQNYGPYTVCFSLYDDTTLCDSQCTTIWIDSNSCEADFFYSANGLNASFTNTSSGGISGCLLGFW